MMKKYKDSSNGRKEGSFDVFYQLKAVVISSDIGVDKGLII